MLQAPCGTVNYRSSMMVPGKMAEVLRTSVELSGLTLPNVIQFAAWSLLSGLFRNLASSVLKCRMLLDHLNETYFLSNSFQDTVPGIGFHFASFLELMLALFGTPCSASKNNVTSCA